MQQMTVAVEFRASFARPVIFVGNYKFIMHNILNPALQN